MESDLLCISSQIIKISKFKFMIKKLIFYWNVIILVGTQSMLKYWIAKIMNLGSLFYQEHLILFIYLLNLKSKKEFGPFPFLYGQKILSLRQKYEINQF